MEKFLNSSKIYAPLLFKRFFSSFMLLLILGATLFVGPLGIKVLIVLICFFSANEWCSMTRITQKKIAARVMVLCFAIAFLHVELVYPYAALGWIFLFCAVAMFMSWLTWRRGFFWMGVGILYIGVPVVSAWILISVFDKFMYVFVWGILVVMANDIGGYILGKLIGGIKLAPKISPKKTWAGFFGGLSLVLIVCWCYYNMVSFETPLPLFLFTSFILCLAATAGDLLESGIKRYHGRKDSGMLIPGHGGVLDRMDGVFATIPFLALLVFLQTSYFNQMIPDEKLLTVLLENNTILD